MNQSLNILILSAYHADSHEYWARTLMRSLPEYSWTLVTLPPRYFAWRVRGNSLSWAFGEQRAQLDRDFDLIIATSMVDLSALRGFCTKLANVPTLVYFHENQFAYPLSGREVSPVEPQFLSIYTALCADEIVFNSAFNQQTFLEGARHLLKKMPDHLPKGLIDRLEQRSSILPVPLDLGTERSFRPKWQQDRPVRLLWNARWEFDKGPDRLLNLLNCLKEQKLEFELALLGPGFRAVPESIAEIERLHKSALVQLGYVDSKAEYNRWLAWTDLVISTALHEFQGLGVLEAVAAGAVPLLPNRQVYSEIFDSDFLYQGDEQDPLREAEAAATKLVELIHGLNTNKLESPNVEHYGCESLIPQYRKLIEQLTSL